MAKPRNKRNNLVDRIMAHLQAGSLEPLFENPALRKQVLRLADRKLRETLLEDKAFPRRVQEDKYALTRNFIYTAERVYEKAAKAPAVRRAVFGSVARNIVMRDKERVSRFESEFGQPPPTFITVSPGKFCNLRCSGCYASSSSASSEKLEWDVLDRIVTEKTDLWASNFTVISGGEPLLYRSKGKTVIDLAKKHQDNYFLMYTNGLLIGKAMAAKLAEVGNIVAAISVEGYEAETDARRGSGTHQRILQSMANLREAGVPFGISLTATKNNADLIDDKFADFYFGECGADFGWIFQLMPIGRASSLELMVTPSQRVSLLRRVQKMVHERKIFIADFWNSGCVTNGCISAGKPGGYVYIEWNGNVTPCVFNPYSPVNINDIYKRGGTINDVLREPFMADIRQWQKDYANEKNPLRIGNWLVPCAIKDHFDEMEKLIMKHKPKPIDEAAAIAINDPEYRDGLKRYGREAAAALDPIWEEEYLGLPKNGKARAALAPKMKPAPRGEQ